MRNLVRVCVLIALAFMSHQPVNAETLNVDTRTLISDQIAKYAQFWDRKDAEAFSELFTEDGVLAWHLAGTSEQPPLLAGRENILKYAQHAHAGRLAGRQSRHHFSGLVFESITENSASTEHIFMVTHVIPNEPPFIQNTGIYRIEWRKTDDVWLMSRRTLHVDRSVN